MKYTYQLYGDGNIYSSRIKAHRALCENLGRDEDEFLPYKEKLNTKRGWIEIHYANCHTIIQRPLL